ncbi:hypothetical protein ACTTAI_01315 [Rhodobacter capsulatus]|uniref:hypothetical protein n=1 Tax=Rhodobacter capsulatus TaxID=1061 RepID=UPI0040298494
MYDDLRANNRETFSELARLFDIPLSAARKVTNALDDAMAAVTFEDKAAALTRLRTELEAIPGGIDLSDKAQREFYQSIVSSEEAMKELAASAPRAGWLAAAIDGASTLAGKLWEAAAARAAAVSDAGGLTTMDDERGSQRGQVGSATIYNRQQAARSSGGGRRRGGGRGRGGADRAIERLLADLETEREVVAAWYQERFVLRCRMHSPRLRLRAQWKSADPFFRHSCPYHPRFRFRTPSDARPFCDGQHRCGRRVDPAV